MKKDDTQLYFLALIPSQEIVEDLTELKNQFAVKYQSKASLNSLPHITLHMPFRWRDKKINLLHSCIQQIAEQTSEFEIELQNFNGFKPKAIFVDVKENESLNFLQYQVQKDFRRVLKLMNSNYKNQAFHPHITLAFRDLSKENYQKAWQEFKDEKYSKSFLVQQITLLKHDGENWITEKKFGF